jgi:type II secretory pathway pseudopilin PulG
MEHNAKHFALQLGALITLYVSIGSLISVMFGIITLAFPDPIDSYWVNESAMESIRWGMSLLVVFFPTYVALTRTINVNRRTSGGSYLNITKWLIYLSLVVGGCVLLGDLVAIINNFLHGELTTRFILQALTVLIVVGLAFFYYLLDAREYWHTHESLSKRYGLLTSAIVAIVIVGGYLHIETPSEVREKRMDTQQISDLTTIQSFIESEYSMSGTLPETLSELSDRNTIPTAPSGRSAYEYRKESATSFQLCATFTYPSDPNQYDMGYYSVPEYGIKNPNDWNHKEGQTCFPRVIEPYSTQPPAVPVM